MVTTGETGDVTDVADDGGGDDRSDAEQFAQRRLRRSRPRRRFVDVLVSRSSSVEAGEVGDEFCGELTSSCRNSAVRLDVVEQASGLSCTDLGGDAAGHEVAQDGVQSAGDTGCDAAPVPGAVSPTPSSPPRGSSVGTSRRFVERSVATATERASLGSFLLMSPMASSRTRAASLAVHVDDPLAGGDELLGQQVAESTSAFDRPGALRERCGPLPLSRSTWLAADRTRSSPN